MFLIEFILPVFLLFRDRTKIMYLGEYYFICYCAYFVQVKYRLKKQIEDLVRNGTCFIDVIH